MQLQINFNGRFGTSSLVTLYRQGQQLVRTVLKADGIRKLSKGGCVKMRRREGSKNGSHKLKATNVFFSVTLSKKIGKMVFAEKNCVATLYLVLSLNLQMRLQGDHSGLFPGFG